MRRLRVHDRTPTQDQEPLIDRFNDWLQRSGYRLPPCPISQGKNWSVAQHLVEFSQYQGELVSTGASVYPAVMIICQDCGYVMFINAVLIGLA